MAADDISVRAAASVKAAYLKDRPERREWEDAPPFFKWTCGDYPDVQVARTLACQPRLAAAESMRQAGNAAFSDGRLDDALLKCAAAAMPLPACS